MSIRRVENGPSPQDDRTRAGDSEKSGMALPSGRHLTVEIGSPYLTPRCQAMSDLVTPRHLTPVSTLSDRAITQPVGSKGFFSRMATVASGVFSPRGTSIPGSRASSASTVTSASPARLKETSMTTLRAESEMGIKTLRVDEMPSAAESDMEYLSNLQRAFPAPGSSVTIALNPEVDVIGKPKELDRIKVLSTMTNQWKDGSLTSVAGIPLPEVPKLAKFSDYQPYLAQWVEEHLPDDPVGTRLSSISEATSTVAFIKQIAKDYDRRALLSIDGQLPSSKEVAGEGAGSPLSSSEIIKDWVVRSLHRVEAPQRMRILSSIQQGITTPINKMADLLFNRSFSRDYDGDAGGLSMIEPRSLEDVEALRQDKAVSPNITEWVQNEERGWGVSVNTKTNTLTATLFFGLKGSPEMQFKGEETIDILSGRTSVTIARLS